MKRVRERGHYIATCRAFSSSFDLSNCPHAHPRRRRELTQRPSLVLANIAQPMALSWAQIGPRDGWRSFSFWSGHGRHRSRLVVKIQMWFFPHEYFDSATSYHVSVR